MLKKIAILTVGLAATYITCWFAGAGISAAVFNDEEDELEWC